MKEAVHPGKKLDSILKSRGISQRVFSSLIQVPHSTLNSFIVGDKSITVELAIKLQAVELGMSAKQWMHEQLEYDLEKANEQASKDTELIKVWNLIQAKIPVSFFKKQGLIGNELKGNIESILKVYGATNVNEFTGVIDSYTFKHFRKSSAFSELRTNVIAWSFMAEHKALEITPKEKFDNSIEKRSKLISELRQVFKKNKGVIENTKKVLWNYGIKLIQLNRPSKTPVDGKCFMSNGHPAIALSMKYARLDNFAFNVFHELGHVYLHLSKDYSNESFFTNNSDNDKLEFEANEFARNSLIPLILWEEFEMNSFGFSDDEITEFAKKIGIHPAIVWGRVCYEHNSFYRRASKIRETNYIG
jgi:HTH-type transcriptional regulator/antitoxin HigA